MIVGLGGWIHSDPLVPSKLQEILTGYRFMHKLLMGMAMTLVFTLVGCGGEKEEAAVAKPANNPLAAHQQMMKDAQAAKVALEKAADDKKKAIDEATQ